MNQLKAWDSENRRDAATCWKEVMAYWLNGGGKDDYPATWEDLYILLDDAELTEIARKLKDAVTSAAHACVH